MQPLEIDPAAFRSLAASVGDLAAEFLTTLDDRPIFPDTTGARTSAAFGGPPPELGMGATALDELRMVADHARAGNGRWFAYVAGSGEPVGGLGDLYASILNQNVTAWRSTPAAVTIERTVVGWMAALLRCEEFSGSLTGGGSSGTLMGLAMAREALAPANEDGVRPCVVYASTEVHMAVAKAVALLGIGRSNLRLIPVDDDFRMRTDLLAAAIAEDRRRGRLPIAVVATAGTIATGAIDPLEAIAGIARAEDLWLHVDGAYGVPATLVVPEAFVGLALADSVVVDAHKWLYQPIDCSVLLYRDPSAAQRAFAYTDDYARSLFDDPVEGFAFFEESIELTRRFRALKLWLSIRYHGVAAFRAAIADDLRHARLLADLVDAEPTLERLAPVPLSAVCFRWTDGDTGSIDDRNRAILRHVVKRGRVYISNATLDGRFALRACFVNHRTTDDDVAAIVEEVLSAARATA
jgi:aromatic-L-amino-acid/L-tryptophan decarboxylase